MALITGMLNKRSQDSNPDATHSLNNSISAANYVGLAITIMVIALLVGTIIFSVRKRRLRRAQEEMKKHTGESFSASELKQMKASSAPSRSYFSPGRILGF
ncbi:hypothetical protein FRC04_000226 [Tulasnella sp. 424]|nr:hypothetical protein FRC04_000226 [Tulasnella sp. 424]KAG8982089.1 hypothetical protein FRC05_000231 [Tulasnella sp. 425]